MSNIDDIFKKGLDGKGLEYSDGHWAGVEQMLGSQKVGFFARYKAYLGVLSLLVICSGSLLYFLNEGTDRNTADTPTAVSENTIGQTATIEAGNGNTINTPNKNALSEMDIVKTDEIKNETTPITQSTTLQDPSGLQNLNPLDYGSSKSRTTLDPMDNGFRIPEPDFTNRSGSSFSPSTINPHTISSPSLITLHPTVDRKLIKPDFGELITANALTLNTIEADVSTNKLGVLDFLPNRNAKRIGVYISPYSGYVNYDKKVILPEIESDLDKNLGKSEAINSVNYGINVGIKKGNWMLNSGLGILNLKEKTKYTRLVQDYDYITAPRMSNSNYTTTPRGTRVALVEQRNVDSTLNVSSESICNDCVIEFNYISVPLQVQYAYGKRKLRYFADVGVTFSLLQNANGDYASIRNEVTDSITSSYVQIIDLQNSKVVSKALLQANASVGAKYWLTPKWSVWTSYGCGLGLNSMLGTYEQKPTIQNLRLGLEFKLR
jgi:hypothetical protein